MALWQGSRTNDIPSVDVDNRAGMVAVLEHLAGLGHRRIAFIGGRRLGDIQDREDAFRQFMAGHPEDASIEYASNDLDGGADALGRLLDRPRPPTAVVASTDVLALGALHRAYERGVRVPDDLSVTGFDDIPFAAASIPALTTVRMPVREMVADGPARGLRRAGRRRPGPPGAPVAGPVARGPRVDRPPGRLTRDRSVADGAPCRGLRPVAQRSKRRCRTAWIETEMRMIAP